MPSSFSDPLCCRYARTLAFLLVNNKIEDHKNLLHREQYEYFNGFFRDYQQNFNVAQTAYCKQIQVLKKTFGRFSKDNPLGRKEYLEIFKPEAWTKLTQAKKREHSLENCIYCKTFHAREQSLFPVLALKYKSKCAENPYRMSKAVKIPKKGTLSEITKEIYTNINKQFSKVTGVEFSEALTTVKELELTKKLSKNEKKKRLRQKYTKQKESIEKHLNETALKR